jgi:hypothetical protein
MYRKLIVMIRLSDVDLRVDDGRSVQLKRPIFYPEAAVVVGGAYTHLLPLTWKPGSH